MEFSIYKRPRTTPRNNPLVFIDQEDSRFWASEDHPGIILYYYVTKMYSCVKFISCSLITTSLIAKCQCPSHFVLCLLSKQWWENYGNFDLPNLAKFAKRILTQPVNASGKLLL